MTIGVVIVNYNSGDYLTCCLTSVQSQTLAPTRVIVVDNASSDGSLDQARAAHPDVEYVENRDNVGFAAANNQAFRMLSEGGDIDCVALLNPDAVAESGWLAGLVAAADRHPEAGSFASRMMLADRPGTLDGFGDVYHVSGLAWRRYHGRALSSVTLREEPVFGACAGAALYRLQPVLNVGGFDEDLFCYLEDVDLAFRLQLAGYSCIAVPDAIVSHVGQVSSAAQPDFALFHGHRNLVWVYLANMPVWWLILTLPLHVAVNVAGLLRSALRGQGAVTWRAKREALHGFRRALDKRDMRSGHRREVWTLLSKASRRGAD